VRENNDYAEQEKRNSPAHPLAYPREDGGNDGAAAAERVPLAEPYLCPGDRRPKGETLVSASTLQAKAKTGGNVAAAKEIGKSIAELAVAKGIKRVVFDRGGFLYHGRIKALADAAREAGLEF
jgi:hypothetical protein